MMGGCHVIVVTVIDGRWYCNSNGCNKRMRIVTDLGHSPSDLTGGL